MIVDEFITLLSFDADVKGGQKFDGVLKAVKDHAKLLAGAITGAAFAVGYFAHRTAENLAVNKRWADSIGAMTDSIQRLEFAASTVGGSLDELRSDIEMMSPMAAKTGQSLEDLFAIDAKRIEGMDAAASHMILRQRGYSEAMIKLLQQGEDSFRASMKGAIIIPPESLKSAVEFSKTWAILGSTISQTLQAGVANALPHLQGLLTAIQQLIVDNKELIVSGVGGFFQGFALAMKAIVYPAIAVMKILSPILSLIDTLTFGLLPVTAGTLLFSGALAILAAVGLFKAGAGLIGMLKLLPIFLLNIKLAMKAVLQLIGSLQIEALWHGVVNGSIWKSIGAYLRLVAVQSLHIAKLGAWIIQAGIAAIVSGGLTTGLAAAATAAWAFTAALLANPITWVVVGIMAMVAALALAVIYWDKIAAFFKWIKEGKSGMAGFLKILTSSLMPLIQIYYYFEKIMAVVKFFGNIAAKVFGLITDKTSALVDVLSDKLVPVVQSISGIWDGIANTVEKIIGWISGTSILKWFKEGFAELGEFEREGSAGSSPGGKGAMPTAMAYSSPIPQIAYASPSQINNSNRSAVVNQQIDIHAGNVTNPASLAQYMKQSNIFQSAGYGVAGALG